MAVSQLWIWLTLVLVAVSMFQNGIYSAPEESGSRALPRSAGLRTLRSGVA